MLFVTEHKFRKINGEIFTAGSLNDEILGRYVKKFGKITVLAIIEKEKYKKENYSKISDNNISIINMKDLSCLELIRMIRNNSKIIIRLPSPVGSFIAFMARRMQKTIMVEVVGCPWDAFWNHSWRGKLIALPMFLITKYTVRTANFSLYVTNSFLQQRYPTLGYSCGISDVEIKKITDDEFKRRLKKKSSLIKKEKIKIGTLGAVNVAYKGQEYVIKAIKLLEDQGIHNIEYHLYGSGSSSRLKSIAERNGLLNKIIFHGIVDHNSIHGELDELDIYVQPSLTEGLPRSVIEAMARGVPCIGACSGGIPELVEEKLLVSRDKRKMPCQIAEKLRYLIFSKDIIEHIHYSINKSNEFSPDILEYKRNEFWGKYISKIH